MKLRNQLKTEKTGKLVFFHISAEKNGFMTTSVSFTAPKNMLTSNVTFHSLTVNSYMSGKICTYQR